MALNCIKHVVLGDVKDREHTLRAMHYLVRHTGFVIEPYTRYPTLLDTLMNILKTEQSLNVRLARGLGNA